MNSYEQKQEDRRDRLLAASTRADATAENALDRSHQMLDAIPFGQPILVGHYSEGRDRRYRARSEALMRRGISESQRAEELRRRAASVGTAGISSDDPDAIEKIRERVAALKARQDRMKAINSAHARYVKALAKTDSVSGDPRTAADLALDAEGFSDDEKNLIRTYKPDYSWEPHPHPPYRFQNNGANIRRLEQRIEQLERDAKRETVEVAPVEGLRIIQDVEDNRVRIIFDGKPAEEVRRYLKGHGFRWSPMAGAWQRHLNNSGVYAARAFVEWFGASPAHSGSAVRQVQGVSALVLGQTYGSRSKEHRDGREP